jgi:hypothetical protein
VGSGPLTGKVGDGGTHPGSAALVREERTMAWQRSMDVEVLWPAPMVPEVPIIPEGEGEDEARFYWNTKPRGGGVHRGGENWQRRQPRKRREAAQAWPLAWTRG